MSYDCGAKPTVRHSDLVQGSYHDKAFHSTTHHDHTPRCNRMQSCLMASASPAHFHLVLGVVGKGIPSSPGKNKIKIKFLKNNINKIASRHSGHDNSRS